MAVSRCRAPAISRLAPIGRHTSSPQPTSLAGALRWRRTFGSSLLGPAAVAQETGHDGTASTGIEVTDPVLLYHNLVREGKIRRDDTQLRALYQLRPIHETLLDYRPPLHLLTLFDSALLPSPESSSSPKAQLQPLPPWSIHRRSPELIAEAEEEREKVWRMSAREREKALVKVLSAEEELESLDTPKGFLLTGPPGTGKSLLMDLFFDSLPTPFKIRRHYHHFLLSLYSQVFEELERRRLSLDSVISPSGESRHSQAASLALSRGWRSVFASGLSPSSPLLNSSEFVLAQVARDLIRDQGWLLAFDEVQMVDVAGAGIVKRVIEWYWRLGGVVLGTSNRVPEHMYDQGVQRNQLVSFLRALQIRSPVVEVASPHDWRRLDHSTSPSASSNPASDSETGRMSWFTVRTPEEAATWRRAVEDAVGQALGSPASILVYGRAVAVPWASEPRPNGQGRVARFTYSELCEKPLGPADYISLASNFETIVVDGVQSFTVTMKNEARRFITFLDAAYECRIKLLVSADRPIDDIFFPEAATAAKSQKRPADDFQKSSFGNHPDDTIDMSARGAGHPFSADRIYEGDANAPPARTRRQDGDSLTEESLSEALQDLEAPFRPNVSLYERDSAAAFETAAEKKEPEITSPLLLERRARAQSHRSSEAAAPAHPSTLTPGFASLAVFTGEDERFAFKRAVSRLHEMTSPHYWRTAKWRPLDKEARSWERGMREVKEAKWKWATTETAEGEGKEEVEMGMLSVPGLTPERIRTAPRFNGTTASATVVKRPRGTKLDPMTEQTDSGFHSFDPPKISPVHVWGVVDEWGKRAGRWGKGAKAYEEQKDSERQG